MIKIILQFILNKIVYRGKVNINDLSGRQLIETLLFQCILGINRSVPWPVHFTSQIIYPERILRGSRFPGLSIGCFIDGRNRIVIGENVWIGPGVKIISMDHDNKNFDKYIESEPIVIGDNVWLGAGAIILPGVKIPSNTVVGAGSVVTKSFNESASLIAGVPAKVIKNTIN